MLFATQTKDTSKICHSTIVKHSSVYGINALYFILSLLLPHKVVRKNDYFAFLFNWNIIYLPIFTGRKPTGEFFYTFSQNKCLYLSSTSIINSSNTSSKLLNVGNSLYCFQLFQAVLHSKVKSFISNHLWICTFSLHFAVQYQ